MRLVGNDVKGGSEHGDVGADMQKDPILRARVIGSWAEPARELRVSARSGRESRLSTFVIRAPTLNLKPPVSAGVCRVSF